MYAKKSVSMKVVVLLLAVVLLIGCVAGGTVAFLMHKSNSVVNTFVIGNIGGLEITETGDDGNHTTGHVYKIVPGTKIAKYPVVTYTPAPAATGTENVPVYVFVKVDVTTGEGKWAVTDKTYSFDSGKVTWSVGSDWTAVNGQTGVFYKKVDNVTAETTLDIMQKDSDNKTITVSDSIVKNDVDDIAAGLGSITFTAYAIQQDGFNGDVAAAWNQAKNAT